MNLCYHEFIPELAKSLSKQDLRTYLQNYHGVPKNPEYNKLFDASWNMCHKTGNLAVAKQFELYVNRTQPNNK